MELENIIDIDVTPQEVGSLEFDIAEAGPPGEKGEPGLSAYEVYLNAGGTLTEIEWLNSLKGEPGKDGVDGIDGKTPVRGEDFWTQEDIKTIETYCDNFINQQIGIIENGEY